MSNSNPYIGQPNPYGQADNRNSMQANNAINAIAGVSRARTNNFNDNQRNTELVANQNYIPDHNKSSGDLYENSRNSFIKKVYTLLSIQLVITALVCVAAMKT